MDFSASHEQRSTCISFVVSDVHDTVHLCLWLLNSSKDIDQVVLSMLNVNREGQVYPKRDTSLQLSEE